MLIQRSEEISQLTLRLRENPVVGILGPRQCGKTTLSQQFVKKWRKETTFFDLENDRDVNRLNDPLLALGDLKGLVVIDEIQRRPELFPALRVLADRPVKTRFLVLGSASRDLIRQSSESLAGRISYMEIGGFSAHHIPDAQLEQLWIRGGFPKSFLARTAAISFQWRQDFITGFLERDIPQLGLQIPAAMLKRFWSMLAHYHGQIFNASEIGQSLGISDHTAQRYLDILSGTFMIRQLRPWYYNTRKRLVKRPKIYFRDSGILHALISLPDKPALLNHPKLGASWKGFALEEIIRHFQLKENEVFFWGVHTGAELDLVFEKNNQRYGVEIKFTQAPAITPSMTAAVSELGLNRLWVVYPGEESYRLAEKINVVPLRNLKIP